MTDRDKNLEAWNMMTALARAAAERQVRKPDLGVQFTLEAGAKPFSRATEGSACWDMYYYSPEGFTVTLYPHKSVKLRTGVSLAIPHGYEGQVRPRSGLAFTKEVHAFPGTIDSDYRDENYVLLTNHGDTIVMVKPGDRIAQIAIRAVPEVFWEEVDSLPAAGTSRQGGFGSTGE